MLRLNLKLSLIMTERDRLHFSSCTLPSLRAQAIHQGLNLAMIVFSALMIWRGALGVCTLLATASIAEFAPVCLAGLMVFTGSDSPVVVVLSGSMEPAYYRGDILFLWLGSSEISVGEVCVFKLPGRDIPIVHRVLEGTS